ncbi:MAG: TetR/AcrR family transcriptional regulator [Candidatus Binatia bacterium]
MPTNETRRARGRPRSAKARSAILRAARDLLAEGGPAAVTMEGVAARAGVGKPTVYRWWPDRHAVAMAALIEGEAPQAPGRAPRSAIRALGQQLRTIAERFATPTGRHVATMIAASDLETEFSKAFRNHFVLARRAEGRALLEQAIRDGEVRADLDVEVALDLLYGALFFRLLMGHAPLDESFMDEVLRHALRGLRRRRV